MISLILAAAFLGCDPPRQVAYGYARSYTAPTYYRAATYYQPQQYQAQTYYQPQQYQQPLYNYSLVGDYMRQESAYQAAVKSEAKLDVLLKLLTEKATPPPVQAPAPQPQFQQPYATPQQPSKSPPVQFEQPYPTAQQPSKAPPAEQFQYPSQPSQQYPGQPQWAAPQDQPPYSGKPSPAPSPVTPSFESSAWVPPVNSGGGYGGVAAMTSLFQTRCVECHVGTSDKGGGVKLLELDGQLADITPYLDEIGKAVASGRMPKKGPRLNDRELYTVFSGLREYAATSRNRTNVVASFGQ
jgi:hypothetical protein